MSLDANKKLVKQFYDAINRMDFGALEDLCHEKFVFFTQVDAPKPGVDGFINSEKSVFEAFEAFRFPLVTMVAEGDKVAAYLVFEGKNQKLSTVGAEPHGKSCRISVLCLLTIRDGKILEERAHFDIADIRQQLSA
jgi:predicted ester cyclase